MAGVFDHLHIKRHTAGSSNELSFDVLDAARTDLDSKKSKKVEFPLSAGQPKGSYHGVSSGATLSNQAEVEKRKKARQSYTIKIQILSIAILIILLGIVGWFSYQRYLDAQTFSERFDSLANQLSSHDEFLSQVDLLMSEINDNSSENERSQVLSAIPQTLQAMESVSQNIPLVEKLAIDEQDQEVLSLLKDTADQRYEMLLAAQSAFTVADQRDNRVKQACTLWNNVVNEGQSAKDAAAMANKATTEQETKKAQESTRNVLDAMKASYSDLKSLAESVPTVDFTQQLAYIDKRTASLECAIETADALLSGDREKASEKNRQYNEYDKEAAEMAKKLPLSVEDNVEQPYTTVLDPLIERYSVSKQHVVSADESISSYLSTR